MNASMQSNALKEMDAHRLVKMTINEILQNVRTLLGPGASDAFIIRNGAPYYTRDGLEVMKSLTFDNEFAKYIHSIILQATVNQGKRIGDGTTTLEVLYCYLYLKAREILDNPNHADYDALSVNINAMRTIWMDLVNEIITELKNRAQPMTEEYLLSMLYTCTQDPELAARLYDKLHEAIMAGAYIVPRQSNIATDMEITTYTRPTFKATRQFCVRPVADQIHNAVLYYCNGSLDISHWEVLLAIMSNVISNGADEETHTTKLNIVIVCHGTTDRTRTTLKTLIQKIHEYGINVDDYNNLIIYTLDEYRAFDRNEMEDVVTILTDEPAINGLVQPLTFETLLYRTFWAPGTIENADGSMMDKIDDLETFDTDLRLVDKMKTMFLQPFTISTDEEEGISLDRELGRNAQARHDALQAEIDEEKSDIRKVELSRRMRRMYGMFIDIQVGSVLMKDGQRKLELVMDAIISAAEGVRYGVIVGNSTMTVLKILYDKLRDEITDDRMTAVTRLMYDAFHATIMDLISNAAPEKRRHPDDLEAMFESGDYDIKYFNLTADQYLYWPSNKEVEAIQANETIDTGLAGDTIEILVGDQLIPVTNVVIEPLSVMRAILENSGTPIEIAKTKLFHITGRSGYMNNFVEEVD